MAKKDSAVAIYSRSPVGKFYHPLRYLGEIAATDCRKIAARNRAMKEPLARMFCSCIKKVRKSLKARANKSESRRDKEAGEGEGRAIAICTAEYQITPLPLGGALTDSRRQPIVKIKPPPFGRGLNFIRHGTRTMLQKKRGVTLRKFKWGERPVLDIQPTQTV